MIRICSEFVVLPFYCTSSTKNPLKSWTGHNEQHGIEVRILNDGDS